MLRLPVAIGCALVAACFNPNPPSGIPCSPGGQCPPGQDCIAGICNGTEPPDDGGVSRECESWSSELFDPCALPEVDTSIILQSGFVFDGSEPGSEPPPGSEIAIIEIDNIEVLFVVARNITIESDALVNLGGARPVALVAWDSLVVAGTIDASGIGKPAPGVDPPACMSVTIPSQSPETGGAGGSHLGGIGGDGGGNAAGDPGPRASPLDQVRRLVGGCSGKPAIGDATGGGQGGSGGGALVLAARGTIEIFGGRISVNGDGGQGGDDIGPAGDSAGGGGGGSGGHLILEAPSIALGGSILTANGGGGGGGAGASGSGNPGDPGRDSDQRASGGLSGGDPNSGVGGRGGAGFECNGDSGQSGSGQVDSTAGGGGGGACGSIELLGSIDDIFDAIISPPLFEAPPN